MFSGRWSWRRSLCLRLVRLIRVYTMFSLSVSPLWIFPRFSLRRLSFWLLVFILLGRLALLASAQETATPSPTVIGGEPVPTKYLTATPTYSLSDSGCPDPLPNLSKVSWEYASRCSRCWPTSTPPFPVTPLSTVDIPVYCTPEPIVFATPTPAVAVSGTPPASPVASATPVGSVTPAASGTPPASGVCVVPGATWVSTLAATPTATPSPVVSATPAPVDPSCPAASTWSLFLDFRANSWDIFINRTDTIGEWVSGAGWQAVMVGSQHKGSLVFNAFSPTTNLVKWRYTFYQGTALLQAPRAYRGGVPLAGAASTNGVNLSYAIAATYTDGLRFYAGPDGWAKLGQFVIHDALVCGTGSRPVLPTPTPAPPTPVPVTPVPDSCDVVEWLDSPELVDVTIGDIEPVSRQCFQLLYELDFSWLPNDVLGIPIPDLSLPGVTLCVNFVDLMAIEVFGIPIHLTTFVAFFVLVFLLNRLWA